MGEFYDKWKAAAQSQFLSIKFVGPAGKIRVRFLAFLFVVGVTIAILSSDDVASRAKALSGLLGGAIRALFGGF